MDNKVELAYDARPEKLVVVKDGAIVFASGIGPYQYSTSKLADFLAQEVGEGETFSVLPGCAAASALAMLVAAAVWWR